jgi:hypothetical protein
MRNTLWKRAIVSKKSLLALVVALCATRAFSWSKEMQVECAELGPGATQTYVETFPVKNKFANHIIVTVAASNLGTAGKPKCHLKWTVTGALAGRSKVLFINTEDPEYTENGVAFGGTSSDGTKLLLDFYSAAGDYNDHRPTVYDFTSGSWRLRDVGSRITKLLPSCDYFTMVQGVTDSGDVILYVPKSVYVEKGCPDQGEWLLNMKDDTITRLLKKDAAR